MSENIINRQIIITQWFFPEFPFPKVVFCFCFCFFPLNFQGEMFSVQHLLTRIYIVGMLRKKLHMIDTENYCYNPSFLKPKYDL